MFERTDKDLTLWLRWTSLDKSKKAPDKMSLGIKLRDDLGRIDEAKEKDALKRAAKAYDRLLRDEDPRTPEPQRDGVDVPVTIGAGLAMALRVPDGMYAVENDHVRDMRRYSKYLLAVLDPDARWDDLTSVTYEQTWRKLAQRKLASGVGGKRSTELAIVLLAQAGRWLKRAGKLKQPPAEPEERYGAKLAADWHRITKESSLKPLQPRHTPDEVGRLFLNVDNPAVDPRMRLVFRLAGEARLGQALACWREHLDLSPVGTFGVGRFTIPDNGKKKGTVIDLTPELRAAIDHEMADGYLRDLEAAYRAKRIQRYPLFPGKKLVEGVARVDAMKPIGDRRATDLWHEFELAAGVAIIQGRGWYGVRRTGADMAEDVESDGRALNAITGHELDETRRRIYQQKRRDQVLAKAAAAREAARQNAIEAAAAAAMGIAAAPAEPSHWELMRASKKERRNASRKRAAAREAAAYDPKNCTKCGTEFVPTGPNSKACTTCSPRRIRPAH